MLWQFTGFFPLHLKLSAQFYSVYTFVCVSIVLSLGQSVSLSMCLSVCLSVCLWVARSVCIIYPCCSVRLSFAIAQNHTFSTFFHHDAPNTHPLLFVSSESYFWLWVNLKQLCSLDYDKHLSLSRPFRIIPNIQPVCINMLLIVN